MLVLVLVVSTVAVVVVKVVVVMLEAMAMALLLIDGVGVVCIDAVCGGGGGGVGADASGGGGGGDKYMTSHSAQHTLDQHVAVFNYNGKFNIHDDWKWHAKHTTRRCKCEILYLMLLPVTLAAHLMRFYVVMFCAKKH